jgi:hypothetical protein
LAIAGFLEIYLVLGLEVPSRDAGAADEAMPHGRLSIDSLATQANLNCGFHLLTRDNKQRFGPGVKWRFISSCNSERILASQNLFQTRVLL